MRPRGVPIPLFDMRGFGVVNGETGPREGDAKDCETREGDGGGCCKGRPVARDGVSSVPLRVLSC